MTTLVVKNEHTCHNPQIVKCSSLSLRLKVTMKVMIKKCSKRSNSQTGFMSVEPAESYHNSK